jgi:capsular polysaccharide export protein
MELGSEPIFVGFQHWKRSFIRAFCGLGDAEGKFVRSVPGSFGDRDRIHVWGSRTPDEDIERIPAGCGPVRIEDGFLRSVGLGSDFAEPLSLVVDPHGIYYDATRPSALELFLESHAFTPEELLRARTLRSTILRYDLNKYNLPKAPADHLASSLRRTKKLKILIPGQVEDDASIVYGAGTVRTMLELVAQVRTYRPDAFIVYRPHPEVLSRNRIAESNLSSIRSLVDCVETMTDTHTCGTMVDEVHTLTSLVGFEMLMRGLPVVTYGQPFYAGWGLTDDRELIRPRKRALELDELIYGALIEYPRYFDLRHGCFISPECAARLLAGRIAAPRPSVGVVARKISKARAWLGLWRGGGRWS